MIMTSYNSGILTPSPYSYFLAIIIEGIGAVNMVRSFRPVPGNDPL